MLDDTVPYGMNKRGQADGTQHLGERAVLSAQVTLKGSLAIAVVLNGRLSLRMRCQVREGDLLREKQQEDTGQMEIDALHTAGP